MLPEAVKARGRQKRLFLLMFFSYEAACFWVEGGNRRVVEIAIPVRLRTSPYRVKRGWNSEYQPILCRVRFSWLGGVCKQSLIRVRSETPAAIPSSTLSAVSSRTFEGCPKCSCERVF